MKLRIVEIGPLSDLRAHAAMKLKEHMITTDVIETEGEIRGLNFSNLKFAHVLGFLDVLRQFVTTYFEYRDGNHPPPPWDLGDFGEAELERALVIARKP